MPNTPINSSFIPKQGPVRQPRQTATRQIHALSVLSYIAIAASLVASVAAFLYSIHIKNQLAVEAQNLTNSMSSFNTEDMEQVREFNMRLSQARQRLDASVPVSSIFSALEDVMIGSVMIENLSIIREGDSEMLLNLQLFAENFDAALFQRGVFESSSIIEMVTMKDLSVDIANTVDFIDQNPAVSVSAAISMPIDRIAKDVGVQQETIQPEVNTEVPEMPLETVDIIPTDMIDEVSVEEAISEQAI
jgi:hypothetical protein